MKAIRSLEQHVDSLLSYDFTGSRMRMRCESASCGGRPPDLGDRRGASAEAFSYEEIHDITKIDVWFIDKLAILVEMEQALKSEPLTAELLTRSKTDRVPG